MVKSYFYSDLFRYIRVSELPEDQKSAFSSFVASRLRPLPFVDGEHIEDAFFIWDYESWVASL